MDKKLKNGIKILPYVFMVTGSLISVVGFIGGELFGFINDSDVTLFYHNGFLVFIFGAIILVVGLTTSLVRGIVTELKSKFNK